MVPVFYCSQAENVVLKLKVVLKWKNIYIEKKRCQ